MVRHILTVVDTLMLGDKISDHASNEYLPQPLARDKLGAWDN